MFCVPGSPPSGQDNRRRVCTAGRSLPSPFDPEQQPIPPEQIRISLQLRPGDRLDEATLGQAIERLFATGRYEDIVASGDEAASGVAVTFHTRSKYFLSHITVDGTVPPPGAEQLVNSAALNLGEGFDDETLTAAASQMQAMLRANGFFASTIRYETRNRDTAEQTDVRFIVEPGHRARFATPVLEGDPKFKPSRILRATGWPNPFSLHSWLRGGALSEWREVTDARVQRGLEKVRNTYVKKGFLMASVHLSAPDPRRGRQYGHATHQDRGWSEGGRSRRGRPCLPRDAKESAAHFPRAQH